MAIQSLRGMSDILPPQSNLWRKIEEKIVEISRAFGISEIRLPIMEQEELFLRSVGSETDIVSKEMYRLTDRKGVPIALRPEGTASVVRAFIQHKVYATQSLTKWFYFGPMFRYERPQKGRSREFTQFGFEMLGSPSPKIDAELLFLCHTLYQKLEIKNYRMEINSLGCKDCKSPYIAKLQDFLQEKRGLLCEDCQRRSVSNTLRVFDCKEKRCAQLIDEAPKIPDHLCKFCSSHFGELQEALDKLEVPFVLNKRIARGLDYYTRTAFEIVSPDLGAKDALGGGGRYDNLVEELGGPPTPAIGYAGGVERLVLLMGEEELISPFIYIAALGEEAEKFGFHLVNRLRARGVVAECGFGKKNLKGQLRHADRVKASYVVIIGDNELKASQIKLKDMQGEKQREVSMHIIEEEVARLWSLSKGSR